MFFEREGHFLSSNSWYVALDLDTNVYEEAVSTIRADVLQIEKHKTEFTLVSELKQIEMTLDTLELKLHYFQQILPRRDRRRGLINL